MTQWFSHKIAQLNYGEREKMFSVLFPDHACLRDKVGREDNNRLTSGPGPAYRNNFIGCDNN